MFFNFQVFESALESNETFKTYIGSRDQAPCFSDVEKHEILITREKNSEVIKYNTNLTAQFINDSFICYSSVGDSTSNNLIVILKEDTLFHKFSKKILNVAGNSYGVICLNLKGCDTIYQWEISSSKIMPMNIIGTIQSVTENFVYYTVDAPIKGAPFPNVNLLRYKYKLRGESEIVLQNISGEAITVMDDRLVYDKRLIAGEFKPILYDIPRKMEVEFTLDKKDEDGIPYLSANKEEIVFYDIKNLNESTYSITNIFNGK